MKVKRYNGDSLEKIRKAIIKELGEDAVIVNIKKNDDGKGGLLPFKKGGKPAFEVIAAAEDAINVDDVDLEDSGGVTVNQLIETQREQYLGIRRSMKMLDEKLADVDERMDQFSQGIRAMGRSDDLVNVHEEWRPLVMEAAMKISESDHPSREDLHEALASLVPTAGGIMFRRTPSSPPDTYVFVGSTGVGKTTTLAKLAARCVLNEGLNVGLISLDTFRVAAVDQLKEYSSLLGVEVAVAFSPEELVKRLEEYRGKDVVLIDTPGRGQFDEKGVKELAEILGGVESLCVALVVSAGIRQEDAEAMFENYSQLKPSILIITKTDEATRCDGLTRLLAQTNLPILYLTDGQRVPEDIHVASPGIVASLVMPLVDCPEPIRIGNRNHDD